MSDCSPQNRYGLRKKSHGAENSYLIPSWKGYTVGAAWAVLNKSKTNNIKRNICSSANTCNYWILLSSVMNRLNRSASFETEKPLAQGFVLRCVSSRGSAMRPCSCPETTIFSHVTCQRPLPAWTWRKMPTFAFGANGNVCFSQIQTKPSISQFGYICNALTESHKLRKPPIL